MAGNRPIIEIKNLCHRFPNGKTAVEDLNLIIENDSFTVICGENGSGKTVLMKHSERHSRTYFGRGIDKRHIGKSGPGECLPGDRLCFSELSLTVRSADSRR